jgi:hypothetical protein
MANQMTVPGNSLDWIRRTVLDGFDAACRDLSLLQQLRELVGCQLPVIVMAQEAITALNAKNPEPGERGSCCNGHPLDADELQVLLRRALDFEA